MQGLRYVRPASPEERHCRIPRTHLDNDTSHRGVPAHPPEDERCHSNRIRPGHGGYRTGTSVPDDHRAARTVSSHRHLQHANPANTIMPFKLARVTNTDNKSSDWPLAPPAYSALRLSRGGSWIRMIVGGSEELCDDDRWSTRLSRRARPR